jgi:hypothetical protein
MTWLLSDGQVIGRIQWTAMGLKPTDWGGGHLRVRPGVDPQPPPQI